MAGKKYGLGEKYKALGVGKATLSINPMQDDLKKLKGMGAAIGVSSKFAQRALIGGGKTKIASAIKTSVKDKVKKGVLTARKVKRKSFRKIWVSKLRRKCTAAL